MIYQINIKGQLDQSWSNWLGDVEIITNTSEDGTAITTLIVDIIDQPALFGILDRIRDLNLFLINVTNMEEKVG